MISRNSFNASPLCSSMDNINKSEVSNFMRKEVESLVREMETRLFADLYAVCVPTKNRKETQKTVRQLRKKQWSKALKETKGNESKAIDLLFESY